MSHVTVMLNAIEQGDPHATEDLLPLVYDELRRVAAYRLSLETPGQTLQPTALVHEAYLRLIGDEGARWENSHHFFGAAALAMRRILVDRARRKGRLRHGGGQKRFSLEEIEVAIETPDERLVFVDEALERFAQKDPGCAELVHLRFFAGLSHEQASRVLGIPERTARRNWAYARAWFRREFGRMERTEA
jgi:RNA polymerase sigma factor (TIGR02999 family)